MRRILIVLCLCISIWNAGNLAWSDPVISPVQIQPVAIMIPLTGPIGPAVQAFFHRSLLIAEKEKARVFIVQMDTPGGLSKSMRKIIKDILNSAIPVITYVAPSGSRAASAGTYILYASHLAAMAPGTHLGAATPVQIGMPGSDKKKTNTRKSRPSATKSKAVNDARAYIRSLAQLRGRNALWGEKAVTQAATLSAKEALRMRVINFIALDLKALLRQSNHRIVKVQGKETVLKTDDLSVKTLLPDWRTKILSIITDPSVAYLLLIIGFYGLFFELANPGFILPGVVGGVSFLLALYAFQLLPISYAGLGLMLLGLTFIVAEIFVPSFGVLGIGGGVAFVIGSVLLIEPNAQGFHIPWYLIITVVVLTIGFVVLVLNFLLRLRKKPIVSGREEIIGFRGKVLVDSDHRMWLRIYGERWQCRSDQPIKNGQNVVVVRLEGLICIVEP